MTAPTATRRHNLAAPITLDLVSRVAEQVTRQGVGVTAWHATAEPYRLEVHLRRLDGGWLPGAELQRLARHFGCPWAAGDDLLRLTEVVVGAWRRQAVTGTLPDGRALVLVDITSRA